ncbi:regulatory component of sensory transduction system [Enterovibrio norvegicus FF-33]|uniref:two-component system response regulator n=1 Tax=Enterovibrio norvegicus TaxID=188144 RepID=UPI0002EBC604|nr:EAL domain-containing response regulator [Enterovibrio norvegicus]OEE67412.1 regulatory component of sensory transduction system [Enterovibrio norvegicus FF-33]
MLANHSATDKDTVLIIDASPNSIRILNAILGEEYRVIFSTTGATARVLMKSEQPKLILMDVELPDIDGFVLCQSFKNDLTTKDIPIILITEHQEDESREMGLRIGCADYISKPVSPAEVKLRIYNQLRIRRNEDLIMQRALYDSLTGLANRNLALDRLRHAIAHDLRRGLLTAVMLLDIDSFKIINDTLSHDVGDQVLVELSRRIVDAVREVDTVGRVSGDEFLIVLPGLHQTENACQIASKLRKALNKPISVNGGGEVHVTASIGISISPLDTDDFKRLFANADIAKHQAKSGGKDSYRMFTSEMNDNVHRRLRIEYHLVWALARNELSVVYQPFIDLKTNEVVGAEALLRWDNSELGSVSPVEFIPIAEQSNLIYEVGKFVLATAIRDFSHLTNAAGHLLNVAVNISPQQIRQANFIDDLQAIMDSEEFAPERLELEVTEGLLLSQQPYVKEMIAKLHDMGMALSMDDFGTGYSSLSYLLQFPFDALKIDREFIDGITDVELNEALATAVISMAQGLKMKTVAEGVETQEQLEMLKSKGCDLAQGYYLSRPIDIDAFRLFLGIEDVLEQQLADNESEAAQN